MLRDVTLPSGEQRQIEITTQTIIAVDRVRAGETLTAVALDCGVSTRTVRRWCERSDKCVGKRTASQREMPVERDDGTLYANVYDAAWEIYLTTDALGYKGIVSSIVDACNGKHGVRAPYGHTWKWYEEE